MNNLRQITSYVRCAVDKYDMINDGDSVAVGLSGGKDSLVLLASLAELRRFYPKKFKLSAVSLDPCFFGEETDFSPVIELCRRLDVPYYIKRTNLWDVVFNQRREKNPCSFCAKMRRGILHDICVQNSCNVIALGHHMDDAAETFYMNLFNGGNISCFSPKSYLSQKNIHMIRPMIFVREKDVLSVSKKLSLPVVKSPCPVDRETERQKVKCLISELDKIYPGIVKKTIGAIQRKNIERW